MDMNDEILASNNLIEISDTSSIASYVMQPRKANYILKAQSREVQAQKYLDKLEKVKTKVVKRKLNLEEYNNQLKGDQGFVRIGQENEFDEQEKDDAEVFEKDSKNLKIKKQKSKSKNSVGLNIKENSVFNKPKGNKKKNKVKEDGFNVNYQDMNKKDNFVFFELLATYADSYLDKKDVNKEEFDQKASKKR
mmetsp:Transcript_25096/g.27847  ORF Transcript_25096/g.27847 Transcript_25096/m.27847 type:complete len:192 (+) Transcript_25096:272-847(+)